MAASSIFDTLASALKEAAQGFAATIGLTPTPKPEPEPAPDLRAMPQPGLTPTPAVASLAPSIGPSLTPAPGLIPPHLGAANRNSAEPAAATQSLSMVPQYNSFIHNPGPAYPSFKPQPEPKPRPEKALTYSPAITPFPARPSLG